MFHVKHFTPKSSIVWCETYHKIPKKVCETLICPFFIYTRCCVNIINEIQVYISIKILWNINFISAIII